FVSCATSTLLYHPQPHSSPPRRSSDLSPIARFLSGYMLGIAPAGRFAFSSSAADATDYNTLDRWTSEYRPDRLVSMGRLGGELRSEEHTSELQSRENLVCRLLLEKKKE